MSELTSFFKHLEPQMIQWLKDLINTDTPSDHKRELDGLASHLAEKFRAKGAHTVTTNNVEAGNHLLAHWPSIDPSRKQILILGHLDTVWPIGESTRRPARIEDGKIFGPGAFDMRGGLTLILALAEYLNGHHSSEMRPITILLDSDEEIGSHSARSLIESEARKSHAVLVLEPCLPGGALKTFRKGVGRFKVSIQGIAAHAGVDYEKGVSAIRELADQILKLYQLNDPVKGTTVNVGIVHGGALANVIADRAEMEIDVRISSSAEGERVARRIFELEPTQAGARLNVSGEINRPPLERTENIVRLFEQAKTMAQEIGISLQEGSTGGGSDGCFTAALGIPTLDGLGPDGAGPHALYEHVLIESLVPRAALLSQLVLKL